MSVISLYSGAGGIDYGFEAAGFDTRLCLDFDADACATLKASRPHWPVIENDIHLVTGEHILTESGLGRGDAEVLIGGPPCQPFSKSGFWSRGHALRLNDPRAATIEKYLEIVRVVKPRVIFFENVDAIGYAGKDEGLQFLLAGLRQIDKVEKTRYMARPSWRIVDAADYGVPQHRNRFILIAARDGSRFAFPPPTHGPTDLVTEDDSVEPYRTTWDALGDLDVDAFPASLRLTGKWAALLPSIPEGKNYLWHTARGGGEPLFGWRTRYWCFLLKLAKDQPSWTLQAQPGPATGPFHWRDRYLTARELCRLQTFPDDVLVSGDRKAAQKQLGNAVPSLLAEVLAREIRTQLLGLPLVSERPVLLPPRRLPMPAPERPAPVPEAYLHLIGDHAAHPGTGKGPGALARVVAA